MMPSKYPTPVVPLRNHPPKNPSVRMWLRAFEGHTTTELAALIDANPRALWHWENSETGEIPETPQGNRYGVWLTLADAAHPRLRTHYPRINPTDFQRLTYAEVEGHTLLSAPTIARIRRGEEVSPLTVARVFKAYPHVIDWIPYLVAPAAAAAPSAPISGPRHPEVQSRAIEVLREHQHPYSGMLSETCRLLSNRALFPGLREDRYQQWADFFLDVSTGKAVGGYFAVTAGRAPNGRRTLIITDRGL